LKAIYLSLKDIKLNQPCEEKQSTNAITPFQGRVIPA
jgi:hypothetical protein